VRIGRVAIPAAVVLGLALPCPGASAKAGLELTGSGKARFPQRSFTLTLPPGRFATSEQIELRENGRLVDDVSVAPAGAAEAGRFDVVLAIDTSKSMRGRAIEEAMAAARAFADRRAPGQRLGIVTFSGRVDIALRPTSSEDAIDRVLARPPGLTSGTRILDAVSGAVSLLAGEGVTGGSVVVLSDGSDRGSSRSQANVLAAAEKAGVRIFSVGLRSGDFEPALLSELARGGHGEYSEAHSAAELSDIFEQLGRLLANQYALRYRSTSGPGSKVRVHVRVSGVPGTAAAEYAAPKLGSAAAPFRRSPSNKFWGSTLAMVAVSLGCGLLIGVALLALLGPRSRSRSLRKRMEGFLLSDTDGDGSKRWSAALTGKVLEEAEKSLEQAGWWPRFKEELETAGVEQPPVQLVVATFFGVFVVGWLATLMAGTPAAFLIGLGVPVVARIVVKAKLRRQRKLFEEQLADHLQVVASAMRAGHSLAGALDTSLEDAPEPTREQFGRAVSDERLGVPLEEALAGIARRMRSLEMEHIALVAMLQRQTGGNAAEIFDRVIETIRERQELRRMVQGLTAQGRLSRWVMTAIPFALLGMIGLLNPEYLEPLFTRPEGKAMVLIGLAMIAAGSYAIKRIVEIEV
jgi:tight adherence protein B